jgi:hypothetical protein
MVASAKQGMWWNHGNPTVLKNPNPLLSKAEWCKNFVTQTTLSG